MKSVLISQKGSNKMATHFGFFTVIQDTPIIVLTAWRSRLGTSIRT